MFRNILILYSEFMPYNLTVWAAMRREGKLDIHIVYWNHKKLTPYQYDGVEYKFYKRSEFTTESLVELYAAVSPSTLFVSGRMDSGYLAVAKMAKRKGIPVVMGSDKQWKGSLKDWCAVLLRNVLYRPYFSHAWVPGKRQVEYARHVGFSTQHIIQGLYIGDTELFCRQKESIPASKRDLLFVGRLEAIKGLIPLIDCLQNLRISGDFKGRLLIFGNGSLYDAIPDREWILKKGFVSQQEIKEGISSCSIFCLPSIEEPWGVVVQEMASAGLLICCSSAVGAGDHFVKHLENGYVFKTSRWDDLKDGLKYLLNLDKEAVQKGRELSYRLAKQMNAADSARFFLDIR